MRPEKKPIRTGLASVYVCHSDGFSGTLRPAYDSAPTATALLTEKQVSTLRSLIARYMAKCRERNRIDCNTCGGGGCPECCPGLEEE